MDLTLVSHHLCPYVQRAAIVLAEKGLAFTRRDIDLSAKPDWFLKISPLGKTPVLVADGTPIFESAVIVEYLEDVFGPNLHPADPLIRARHRAWMEFGSAVLNDIADLYNAPEAASFDTRRTALLGRFARLEAELGPGPFFAGSDFSIVDAVFGPVFRYFDTFEAHAGLHLFDEMPKVTAWRRALSDRPSVRDAVAPDYPARLVAFIRNRGAHLSRLVEEVPA